jgi:hypothetical protein
VFPKLKLSGRFRAAFFVSNLSSDLVLYGLWAASVSTVSVRNFVAWRLADLDCARSPHDKVICGLLDCGQAAQTGARRQPSGFTKATHRKAISGQ